ncbi:T9SS type A sorting domain-containing protein [Hymenobacter negativus]|uniref:T9SS type A sorting domain-containing protein n=1 Tax=Hymenobacter negativus TaxID=2795026 RepID=A0ABS3QEW9_9BACT|nr:T9SS type A sorting domain-containing protein [Hymenobacter negativus]MBO2009354.1 T9SS type A sorting domain-containing protein [Hymenobacter negativus]
MKRKLLPTLFVLLLVLLGPARAATPPPAPGHSLAEALNPDGTLRPGLNGSFDVRQFRVSTAPDGRPVFRPLGTTGAGDERWQSGFSLFNGADTAIKTIVQSGTDIYVGGSFTSVGGVKASYVAKWDGSAWSSLGTGMANGGAEGTVMTLAVAVNGDVYAGGDFIQAGGIAANYVAKWNGTTWSSLGTGAANGVNGSVLSLAIAGNGDVLVGGDFTQAGGISAGHVARWNGSVWSTLGTGASNGVDTGVMALAVAGNGDIYVGGYPRIAGLITVNNVAKWNGTTWSPLNGGVNGDVRVMTVTSSGELYVGGTFSQAGGTAASNVAKWNGSAWSSLGTGTNNGVNGGVMALAVASNGDVYVGGSFSQAGGAAANRIARWNTTTWSTLGTGATNGANSDVFALKLGSNGDVYIGGDFTQAGGAATSFLTKWNGTAWSSLGSAAVSNGLNRQINALTVAANGDVYVGGYFTQAGGTAANYIAKWNGTTWSSLGSGVANGLNGEVFALTIGSNGDVYAGGNFTQAGGLPANYIARWNGSAWSSMGTGPSNGVNYFVRTLAVASNGDLYAGGNFSQAGGTAANNVAKWNGTTWSSLGTGTANGVDVGVIALAVAGNSEVYVGGYFTQAGGIAANYIAKWNGTAWSNLGTGLNSNVLGLAAAGNGNVYVSGSFTQAGGIAANRVARWDGTTWNSMGTGTANGVNSYVVALATASNGDVYVGSSYLSQAGGIPVNQVAKWNGTAWSPLGTGVNRQVYALATAPTGKIYVGGDFTTTGDGSKLMARFAIYDPNAPLATAAAKATPAAQLFPNPAHGAATLRLPAGAPRPPLTLTDALGRVVRRYPASATAEAELDLRSLPAGTYVVRCGAYSQRLVVE